MMKTRSFLVQRFLNSVLRFSTDAVEKTKPTPVKQKRKPRPMKQGPDLKEFLPSFDLKTKVFPDPSVYVDPATLRGDGLKVYLDIYGCQMNVSDAELVLGVLSAKGYSRTMDQSEADVWLVVTCSIREGAEDKIWRKLSHIRESVKRGRLASSLVVGVLGCMAERVRAGLLQDGLARVVAGPDSYRDLPRLLASQRLTGQAAINVLLSLQETYSGLDPVRLDDKVSAFVSIQRGCDNMCTYCIVPHTRGKERSRPVEDVLAEVNMLVKQGVREVTLLGQNVNSYRDTSKQSLASFPATVSAEPGFSTVYKPKQGGRRFADLLDMVSSVDPEMRVRFTAPHPKDFPLEVLQLVAERSNICSCLHLPAQAGSSRVLASMGRGYTREAYLALVDRVREVVPAVNITSDFITGFCGETEDDFQQTVDMVEQVGYSKAFIFPYSMREKTRAHRRLVDDVPTEVKAERHLRLKDVFRRKVRALHDTYLATCEEVLVTGDSKRSKQDLQGLTNNGIKVIFPKFREEINIAPRPGDLVTIKITESGSEVLKGKLIGS